MARQYSAKTFFRCVPNEQLKKYFEAKGIDLGLPWVRLDETADIGYIFLALEKLPEEVRAAVDGDFRMINDLACEAGVLAILAEAASWGRDLSSRFEEMSNNYERAFWAFMNEPQRFQAAGRFHEMDRCGGWQRRFVGHNLRPATDEDTLRSFGDALRRIYRWQGRGRFCHVDRYERDEPPRHCFFAYPEDYASSDLAYDEQGRFRQQLHRSAFEIIFVYRPADGILEVRAKGGKKHVGLLEEAFCREILGLKEPPRLDGMEPYNLEALKSRDFQLLTEPRDRVAAVHVRQLRLDLPGTNGRRITVTANASERSPTALHDLLDDVIDQASMPLECMHVSQAKLRFTFMPRNGERPKTLTFEVTYPDRCTLKDDPHDQIAKKYLREWGIARD